MIIGVQGVDKSFYRKVKISYDRIGLENKNKNKIKIKIIGGFVIKDINSLLYFKCYILFSSKYRRQETYGKIKLYIGKILRIFC